VVSLAWAAGTVQTHASPWLTRATRRPSGVNAVYGEPAAAHWRSVSPEQSRDQYHAHRRNGDNELSGAEYQAVCANPQANKGEAGVADMNASGQVTLFNDVTGIPAVASGVRAGHPDPAGSDAALQSGCDWISRDERRSGAGMAGPAVLAHARETGRSGREVWRECVRPRQRCVMRGGAGRRYGAKTGMDPGDPEQIIWGETVMTEHPNIELTRRAYDAFAKGDLAALSEFIADDATWHVQGVGELSGDYHGRDEVCGALSSAPKRACPLPSPVWAVSPGLRWGSMHCTVRCLRVRGPYECWGADAER
jgi:SnoaL-like domain